MKSLAIAALAALSVAAVAAPALAATDYVQAQAGVGFQANRDNGEAYSVAVGHDFGTVRAEAEVVALRGLNDPKLGDTQSNLANINVYVEPVTVYGVTPFVGAGVGYGSLFDRGVKGDRNGVVFNASAGATYPLTDKLTLVGTARYFIANDVDYVKTRGTLDNYKASALTVGLRYNF
jgi:opacity protein-like surface antigen